MFGLADRYDELKEQLDRIMAESPSNNKERKLRVVVDQLEEVECQLDDEWEAARDAWFDGEDGR